jgi:uncharacterized membrane protein (UPF0127 family)
MKHATRMKCAAVRAGRTVRRILPAAGLAVILLAGCNGKESSLRPAVSEQPENQVELEMGGKRVTLEVAKTNAQRMLGLMKRRNLPEDHGMIFIYPESDFLRFWMKDTWIPLSIAFVREDGTVLNIDEMRPFVTDSTYMSLGKCRIAIEMNAGWFEKHGIEKGDRIALTPEILAMDSEPKD